jgi:hypothetical protein
MLPLTVIPGGHLLPASDFLKRTSYFPPAEQTRNADHRITNLDEQVGVYHEPYGSSYEATSGHQHQNPPPEQWQQQDAATQTGPNFMALPPELRRMIWRLALPRQRRFTALHLRQQDLVLERGSVTRMPLAHACFESRAAVVEAGYRLGCQRKDRPGDTGVWVHLKRDGIYVIEQTHKRKGGGASESTRSYTFHPEIFI